MKYCARCDTTKPMSEFNKSKAKKDGLQSSCRPCIKEINRVSYLTNEKRRASIRRDRDKLREYNRSLVTRYKRVCGCQVCEESEPAALDLHHLDPKEKEGNPASLVSYSTKRLKAEIRKYVVLCANCHRKVHAGLLQI